MLVCVLVVVAIQAIVYIYIYIWVERLSSEADVNLMVLPRLSDQFRGAW